MDWRVLLAKSGVPTLELMKENKSYLVHSKYDPITEAQRWVTANYDPTSPGPIVILGLGLGYHVELIARGNPEKTILVWDFNEELYRYLRENGLLDRLQQYSNLQLQVSQSLQKIKDILLPYFDDPHCQLLVHAPSLEAVPEELTSLKGIIDSLIIRLRTIKRFRPLLDRNYQINSLLKDPDIGPWLDRFKDRAGVMVAAGPSLTKQLPLLKELKETTQIVLGCVGTALLPLHRHGITPDFLLITDPQDVITQQFVGVEQLAVPLFYLATANANAVANFLGRRYIVWQKGYPKSEQSALEANMPCVNTGGSVATTLLDLMRLMGFAQIALVGQDLAYTDGLSHATGTHLQTTVQEGFDYIQVEDWFKRNKVITSMNLYTYLLWFEEYASLHHEQVELWNCTEGGAHIRGFTHRPLEEYARRYLRK